MRKKLENGMEPILWFKTKREDETCSIYEIYKYIDIKGAESYVLKSTSDRFEHVDYIKLTEANIADIEKGNFLFTGIVYSNCIIEMQNDDESNPIFDMQARDESKKIGEYDMRQEGKLAITSPIIDINVKNREKVQEMINDGILTFPDNKCIEFKIEPFRSQLEKLQTAA